MFEKSTSGTETLRQAAFLLVWEAFSQSKLFGHEWTRINTNSGLRFVFSNRSDAGCLTVLLCEFDVRKKHLRNWDTAIECDWELNSYGSMDFGQSYANRRNRPRQFESSRMTTDCWFRLLGFALTRFQNSGPMHSPLRFRLRPFRYRITAQAKVRTDDIKYSLQ